MIKGGSEGGEGVIKGGSEGEEQGEKCRADGGRGEGDEGKE